MSAPATEGGDRPGDEPSMRKVWESALEAVVPEGREAAIPWSVVAERVAEKVREVLPDRVFKPETVLRRCQEASSRLRRCSPPVNVIGLSGVGVFRSLNADDLQFQSEQRWRRIRREIREACHIDGVNEAPILASLGQLGLPAESERAA